MSQESTLTHDAAHQRTVALARWDNEGGAGPGHTFNDMRVGAMSQGALLQADAHPVNKSDSGDAAAQLTSM
jgi:hypothetical protein